MDELDELEEIRRRMRITNLQARCELHEIEAAALRREIACPWTSPQRRVNANARRRTLLVELTMIRIELA